MADPDPERVLRARTSHDEPAQPAVFVTLPPPRRSGRRATVRRRLLPPAHRVRHALPDEDVDPPEERQSSV